MVCVNAQKSETSGSVPHCPTHRAHGPIGDHASAVRSFLQFFQIFAMGCVNGQKSETLAWVRAPYPHTRAHDRAHARVWVWMRKCRPTDENMCVRESTCACVRANENVCVGLQAHTVVI